MSYARCFNSHTVGVIQDYKSSYYLIKFPQLGKPMWVHETSILAIWNDEDEDGE